ncbi:hypothetical protein GCM10027034_40450 [Ramlibacter solisilvae]|uniref:Amidohydrolase 3 domain-containing protein n=1 Tax=Ramlibacter tataouinensis TaxID=94132 RepID=A0A127JU10_9BURK|nr:hypothetical protein [Ramlibacter tataouinensis]AMO23456.1 hypothetical protein UC35_11800 [Ramlibacter tataouinensis]
MAAFQEQAPTPLQSIATVRKPGAHADLVLFSPDEVIDCADYANPIRPSRGIRSVFVNGELKVEDGRIAAMPNGRVLRA